jgi:hypothetical protein
MSPDEFKGALTEAEKILQGLPQDMLKEYLNLAKQFSDAGRYKGNNPELGPEGPRKKLEIYLIEHPELSVVIGKLKREHNLTDGSIETLAASVLERRGNGGE